MSVQDRIRAFESVTSTPLHQLSSPRTSLTFSSDDDLTVASSSAPASPKANLLDDMDFVLAGTPSASSSPRSQSFTSATTVKAKPDILRKPPNIESSIAPPLPPRKQPSQISLKAGSTPQLPPRSHTVTSHTKATDSLTVIPANSTSSRSRHQHASSTSSFISLSLSDPGDQDDTTESVEKLRSKFGHSGLVAQKTPTLPQRPTFRPNSTNTSSSASIVSNTSSSSSLAARSSPTRLSPASSYSSHTSFATQTPYQVRRPAPAPPSRPSSALQDHLKPSQNTSLKPTSSFNAGATRRRTPIPPPARARYEALFERNLPNKAIQRNASQFSGFLPSASGAPGIMSTPASPPTRPTRGRMVGWRGLSIDLITATANEDDKTRGTSREQCIDGQTVRTIWSCSKLDRKLLREIWLVSLSISIISVSRNSLLKDRMR